MLPVFDLFLIILAVVLVCGISKWYLNLFDFSGPFGLIILGTRSTARSERDLHSSFGPPKRPRIGCTGARHGQSDHSEALQHPA